jgi:uncharacterized membrane protein
MSMSSFEKYNIGMLIAAIGLGDTLILMGDAFLGINACGPVSEFMGTIVDCGYILHSEYSKFLGIHLSVLGFIYYSIIFTLFIAERRFNEYKDRISSLLLPISTITGLFASGVLVYLQLVVMERICWYCMFSALTSTTLFFFVLFTRILRK